MSTFSIRKSSNQTDIRNPSVAVKSRQQVIQDNNKRRTLLQDNSWIKKRSEEENTDENYGRAVLNQYKSQDGLHRNVNEKEDQKVHLGRYRSDTSLDKISDRSDVEKVNKSPVLDKKPTNRQSWAPTTSVTTTDTTTTSPVKKKRQSWMPPPVSGYKVSTDSVETKRQAQTLPNAATTTTTTDTKRTISSSEQITSQKSTISVEEQTTTREVSPVSPADTERRSITERTTRGKDLDDLNAVNTAAQKDKRGQDLVDVIEVKKSVDQNKKGTTERVSDFPTVPNNQSGTNYFDDAKKGSSCNTSTTYSSSKNTVVYTRTYEKNRKSTNDAQEENVTGKSIKTVYSTSDRTIIEKDMCTYCRKPLGIGAKMILDALQICCHSTCFKCEVCKRPLEDLKAGDSIWIYRKTVHCVPCYSKAKEKWIY
ncbi:PREDICTED: sciellin isoform X2 [Gavialis gangeticus]|uniref:sciellin isoform X2 n=1 Tax=Gavialis gangeticus TaxID=94835 RepID=UPI00092ED082|nr:PREDICTED: sciellin isoform X2 [Gavialis gangeticus]